MLTRGQIARGYVLSVLAGVGLFDLCVGLFLLFGNAPWEAHGPGTLWEAFAAAPLDAATLSLFRRMGAFSCYAGLMSLGLAAFGARDRRVLTAALLLYTIAGPLFLLVDRTYFTGTLYLTVKNVIGALWGGALVVHALTLYVARKTPTPA